MADFEQDRTAAGAAANAAAASSCGYGSFEEIREAIIADPQNADYTARGIGPLYTAGPDARVVIVGQAPGRAAQETRVPWNDQSGDRLRSWLGMGRETFYDPRRVALLPMDFYYPGTGKGGDLPPRKGFAEKWHPALLALMPEVRLTVLVGRYANGRYLRLKSSDSLTDAVRGYGSYLPRFFPLVHPSPRNQLWMKRNPWFEEDVLPALKARVAEALG